MAVPALTNPAHAGYYYPTNNGRIFIGSNAVTGLVIPIYSAKANALTLWNPAGSGYNAVLLELRIGIYSSTTFAIGNIAYFRIAPAGAAIGTASPFPTATFAAPMNAKLVEGQQSKMLFSPAVNTTTDTPTIIMTAGLSALPYTVATLVAGTNMVWVDKLAGLIVVSPNSAVQIYGTTLPGIVANQTLIWEEVPLDED